MHRGSSMLQSKPGYMSLVNHSHQGSSPDLKRNLSQESLKIDLPNHAVDFSKNNNDADLGLFNGRTLDGTQSTRLQKTRLIDRKN